MTVYALYQHYIYLHFKATLIVTYDLISTLLDNIYKNLFWNSSLNRFLFKGSLNKIF
jgi:hypothetical protein